MFYALYALQSLLWLFNSAFVAKKKKKKKKKS